MEATSRSVYAEEILARGVSVPVPFGPAHGVDAGKGSDLRLACTEFSFWLALLEGAMLREVEMLIPQSEEGKEP